MASSLSTTVSDMIERLSSKPGVIASLTVDRTSCSLLSMSGTLTVHAHSPVSNASAAAPLSPTIPGSVSAQQSSSAADSGVVSAEDTEVNRFTQMIWKYVNDTEHMIQNMDDEDDLKLLRLRTKKHEFVIVPDAKFIFVVVHDVKSS